MREKHPLLILITILIISILITSCAGTPPAEPEEPAEPVATEAPAEAEPEEEAMEEAEGISPAKEIVIYNWTEYIEPEVYSLFEEEFGIRVVEDNFSSNEEMMAKLQGGATGYALVVPSDYTVWAMIQDEMLAPLNKENIPNASNLSDQFVDVPYDPQNVYCIPYQWGTTGLGYLDGEIEKPESWDVIFNPDPASPAYGRTTMLDDTREAFAAALVFLGYDINTTDEAQLQEAKQLLIQAKSGLAGYDSDTYEDNLASGENLLAHGWNGDFLVAQEENESVLYTIPQEGGVIWVDNLCIPVTASPEEKLAGEMFINFILRPEIGAMISEFTYFASPNQASEALFDEEFLSDPTVYPPDEVLERLQFISPVGEAESLYQRLWDEIKSS